MKKWKKIVSILLIFGLVLPLILSGNSFRSEAASGKWKKDSKGWYYVYGKKTRATNEWVKQNGKWYFLGNDGYMATGWRELNKKWYYFNPDGVMQTGWKKIAGSWYYFNPGGNMQTGWKKISGSWYYFQTSGIMVTGDRKIGGKKYSFDKNGKMIETSSNDSSSESKGKKAGDIVTFGHYEQDNNTANGTEPIEWIVLEAKEDGSLMLLSRYALNTLPYNEKDVAVTWATSSVRYWLNHIFFYAAFSGGERRKVMTTIVSTDDNPITGASGGDITEDKVFLLSVEEAKRYFKEDKTYEGRLRGFSKERTCKPTEFAKKNGAELALYEDTYQGSTYWWLRTPGEKKSLATYVNQNGSVIAGGMTPTYGRYTIRPVIFVQLDK